MSEVNTDDIKQEVREDIKDIIDDMEEEYDDDDVQLDDSDVDDFLTEDEDDEYDDTETSYKNPTSDNSALPVTEEIIPKLEPLDELTAVHASQNPPVKEKEEPTSEIIYSAAKTVDNSGFYPTEPQNGQYPVELKVENTSDEYFTKPHENNHPAQFHSGGETGHYSNQYPTEPSETKNNHVPYPTVPNSDAIASQPRNNTYPPIKSENVGAGAAYPEVSNNYSSYGYPGQPSYYQQQQGSYQGYPETPSYQSQQVGEYVKDEYVEDEWKKNIKTENLVSLDNLNQPGYRAGPTQTQAQQVAAPNSYQPDYRSVQTQPQAQQGAPPQTGADGWLTDNTVPKGWKHKTTPGNNKTFVCSPGGQKFDSRKNALKFMKANRFPLEEIAMMDDCLKYEGWVVDDLLPAGWKYRPGKNNGPGIDYMTSDFKIIISTSAAATEIAHYYPREVSDRFRSFSAKIKRPRGKAPGAQQVQRTPGLPQVQRTPGAPQGQRPPGMGQQRPPMQRPVRPEEWTADHTIPAGWRMRNSNGNFVLLSPNGLQFYSRRAAFQELVTKNYPDEMKAEMFDKLAYEGFQANELLPFGWIYQKTEQGVNFLSREGRLLSSFQQALQFFRSSRDFSGEEMRRLEMFQNMIFSNNVKVEQPPTPVWNENDQTVPLGWKTRPLGNNGNLKVFLSPNGHEVKNRRMALKHMMQFEYSQEAIEEMRKFLYYEGWMDDQNLPYLWKMKRGGQNLLFVSREGDILENPRVAIDYIMKNPYAYSNEDIQRIEYVSSSVQNSQGNRAQNSQGNRIQVQERRKPGPKPGPGPNKKFDTSYVEDAGVPKGWKVKTDGIRPSYMAPNGNTYKSRRMAYHSMIQERYPNEEIEAMRKTLKYDGWLDNSELPDGWKVKHSKNNVYLMDRGGEYFKSYVEAAKFVESYAQYFSQEDVDKINRLARVNQPGRPGLIPGPTRISNSEWQENDPTVPKGWKSRAGMGTGKGKKLMSPDGVIYPSRRNALELMIKSQASPEQIEQIRMSLTHEGWIKMEIPIGWMFRTVNSYGYHFLTADGTLLESKGQAYEYMMKAGIMTGENKNSIESLKGLGKIKDQTPANKDYTRRVREPQRITPDSSWVLGDPTVPDGWRVKDSVQHGKNKKVLLSPQGLSFGNRRQAISYMTKQNFPQEKIDEIRQTMVHDGWKEDPLLPLYWRYKAKRPFLYCTEDGELLLSHINAIRKLQSSDKYAPDMLPELQKFVDRHGGTRKQYSPRKGGSEKASAGPGIESISRIFASASNREDLMNTLYSMGWKKNEYLPADWLCRDKKEGNQHIDVLSIEGKRFTSYKHAVAFMGSSENYDEKDIQRFYSFPDGKTRVQRMGESRLNSSLDKDGNFSANDWVENDPSVPVGWKSKLWIGSSSKKCLMDPTGRMFKSRLAAFRYLCKSGTEDQLTEMRRVLGSDGWQEYALLPPGWLYKKKEYNNLYLTNMGEKLSGNNIAVKEVQGNSEYNEKVMEDLYKFFEEQKTQEFNSSLKPYQQSSKSGNLRWLVESGADEEAISKARMELMECGWSGNQYLPEDWLHKQKVGTHALNILTSEGVKIISYKAAMHFMRTNAKYTEKDIQRIKLFPDGKFSNSHRGREVDRIPQTPKISPDDPSWEENDQTIPKGWKSRKMEGREVTMLLTPSGAVYWSRRAALKDLLKNGGSEEEVEGIRKGLEYDGWKTFPNLPKAWMYKRKEPRSMYLTETGDLVDGHTKAQKLIADDEKYSVEDQTNIRNFVLEISKTERPSVANSPKLSYSRPLYFESLQEKLRVGNEDEKESARQELEARGWSENEYLPNGWRCRAYKSTKQINVLSSDGELFHSYSAVLQKIASNAEYTNEDAERFKRYPDGKPHMVERKVEERVKNKYFTIKQYQEALKKDDNEEEIREIKEYYLEKGWIEDETILPAMWLFKQKPGLTSLTFLTPTGELLLSTKEANKYMENHGVNHVIDPKLCQARLGTNYELELKRLEKKIKVEANSSVESTIKMETEDDFSFENDVKPEPITSFKVPSGIKIEKTSSESKKGSKVSKKAPDVSNFKFYSLEEFDNKSNGHIAEFKGVFEQLESLKKSISNKKIKSEPSDDLDFDAL